MGVAEDMGDGVRGLFGGAAECGSEGGHALEHTWAAWCANWGARRFPCVLVRSHALMRRLMLLSAR